MLRLFFFLLTLRGALKSAGLECGTIAKEPRHARKFLTHCSRFFERGLPPHSDARKAYSRSLNLGDLWCAVVRFWTIINRCRGQALLN